MKKTLVAILVLLLVSSVGYAQEYSCADSDTSTFSTTIIVDGNSIPIEYNETCNFDCKTETGRCNPSPYDVGLVDIGIMIFLLLVAVVLFYVSFKTDQTVYKLLYFLIGLIFVMGSLLTAITLIQTSGKSPVLGAVETIVWPVLILMFVTTLMLFLMILKDATDLLKGKNMIQ